MPKTRRSFAKSLIALVGLALVGSGQAHGEMITALGSITSNNNFIYTFDSNTPSIANGVTVSNLGTGVTILSIDYRPANGLLYGLGSNSQIYTINTTNGVATSVATLSSALPSDGSQFSIDFNPTVDRLRIVSSNGLNEAVDVSNGAVTMNGNLSSTGVVAAAYTNSVPGASSTTLYDITYTAGTGGSAGLFSLNTQNPMTGVLTPRGSTGIKSFTSLVGFDISGAGNVAYVAGNSTATVGGNATNLYTIDLDSGNISGFLGQIDGAGFQVRGLSAAIVPEPASLALVGLGLVAVGGMSLRRRVSGR